MEQAYLLPQMQTNIMEMSKSTERYPSLLSVVSENHHRAIALDSPWIIF